MNAETMIRVVSLERDLERRERFANSVDDPNIEWKFFDAHTSLMPPLEYDGNLAATRRGRLLSNGELGCYSSHYAIWQQFLDSPARQLIVLEDDTWVDWTFIHQITENDAGAVGIDYLKLSCLNLPPHIMKGRWLGRYVVHFLGYPQGTQGYLLTRRGADQLVAHCRRVAGPIDIVMDQAWWGGMHALCIYPCPVVERTVPSRITAGRQSADLRLPHNLNVQRQWMRVQERVRRSGYHALATLRLVGPSTKLDRRWL